MTLKTKSSAEIGKKFVEDVISKIPNTVNVIKEYTSSRNKFDLILTFPRKNGGGKVIKGNTSQAKKLIEKAESIVILECSKVGKFKDIKGNFGEILKIPALTENKKIKSFYLVHEEIENPKYSVYLEELCRHWLKPVFKVELIELKDIANKIANLWN